MKTIFKTLIICTCLFSLSACVTTGCDDYHSYRGTNAQQPVQVPTDLDQPDNGNLAPTVSVGDKSSIQKDASGNCLDKPPKL